MAEDARSRRLPSKLRRLEWHVCAPRPQPSKLAMQRQADVKVAMRHPGAKSGLLKSSPANAGLDLWVTAGESSCVSVRARPGRLSSEQISQPGRGEFRYHRSRCVVRQRHFIRIHGHAEASEGGDSWLNWAQERRHEP